MQRGVGVEDARIAEAAFRLDDVRGPLAALPEQKGPPGEGRMGENRVGYGSGHGLLLWRKRLPQEEVPLSGGGRQGPLSGKVRRFNAEARRSQRAAEGSLDMPGTSLIIGYHFSG